MVNVVIPLLRTKDRINLGQYYRVKGAPLGSASIALTDTAYS